MNSEHKILEILRYRRTFYGREAYWLMMDCPVQPEKIVVLERGTFLEDGQVFDPHFSNSKVSARLRPCDGGWMQANGL